MPKESGKLLELSTAAFRSIKFLRGLIFSKIFFLMIFVREEEKQMILLPKDDFCPF